MEHNNVKATNEIRNESDQVVKKIVYYIDLQAYNEMQHSDCFLEIDKLYYWRGNAFLK